MGSKDDRMMEAVQKHPCPWCSQSSGYNPGPSTVFDWVSSAARGLALWVNPRKAVQVVFSPGMLAHCRNCLQPVGICGFCDHPNRSAGLEVVCSNCSRIYRPG